MNPNETQQILICKQLLNLDIDEQSLRLKFERLQREIHNKIGLKYPSIDCCISWPRASQSKPISEIISLHNELPRKSWIQLILENTCSKHDNEILKEALYQISIDASSRLGGLYRCHRAGIHRWRIIFDICLELVSIFKYMIITY